MDTNTMIVVVATLFVVLIVVGFILYRRKAKVGIELPGSKLEFEGSNDSPKDRVQKNRRSNGIFGNWSIGKTRIRIKGQGTITDNVSVGDTEIKVENTNLKKRTKSKTNSRKPK